MMFYRALWCLLFSITTAMQEEEETREIHSTPALLRPSINKDITGLSPAALLGPGNSPPHIPLKFWANSRKSALKPRRKDLKETTLTRLLGSDFDSRWMRQHKEPDTAFSGKRDDFEGKTARSMRALVSQNRSDGDSVMIPGLPDEYKELVKEWFIARATCLIHFEWYDLGPYFWPRWISKGECLNDETSCSWPPGMTCVPATAKVLNILRWHCRLKKPNERRRGRSKENAMRYPKGTKEYRKFKKQSKYTCLWIKVPYSVTDDCTCSCTKNQSDVF